MSNSAMTVSVVIPTYNVAATIERAIRSVQEQTRPVHEIILVDDASRDETRDVIRRMAEEDRRIILLESEMNAGPSRARNRGIDRATGDVIAILDGDDAWRPARMEHLCRAMEESGVEFVADNLILYDLWIDQEVRLANLTSKPVTRVDAPTYFANCLREKFQFGLLQPLIRRQFLIDHQLRYPENIRYGEDLLFYADFFLAGARGLVLAEGWYIYTTPVGEASGRKSPHTRSVSDFQPIVNSLRRRLPKTDAATRRQLQRCIDSFETTHKTNLARTLRQEGRYFAYARAIADRKILAQMVKIRLRRWQVQRASRRYRPA